MKLNEMSESRLSAEGKKRWNEKVKGMLIKNKLEESKKEIGCVNRVRERERARDTYDLISTQNSEQLCVTSQRACHENSAHNTQWQEWIALLGVFSPSKGSLLLFSASRKKLIPSKWIEKCASTAQSWWIQWTIFDKMNCTFAFSLPFSIYLVFLLVFKNMQKV